MPLFGAFQELHRNFSKLLLIGSLSRVYRKLGSYRQSRTMRIPTTSCEWLWKNDFLSDIDIKIVETSRGSSCSDRGDFIGSSDIFSRGAGRSVRIPGHALLLCQHSQVLRTLVEIQQQHDVGNPDSEQSAASILRHRQRSLPPPPLQQRPCVLLRVGHGLLNATLLMLEAMYDPLALTKTAAAAAAMQDAHEPMMQSSLTPHQPLHADAEGFHVLYSSDEEEEADFTPPLAYPPDDEAGPHGAYPQQAPPAGNRLLATATWFSAATHDDPLPGAGGSLHLVRRASMHGGPEDGGSFNAPSGGSGGAGGGLGNGGGHGGASHALHAGIAAALGAPSMARLPEDSSDGIDGAPPYFLHNQQEEPDSPMALLLGVIWQADKFQADGVIKV